jgi:hypothetical protein
VKRALLGTLAFLGAVTQAEEMRVVSTRPDAVSVTIYRDLFALITETRVVDLPAGPVTLQFDGVVESLIPQSALVSGTQRAVAESNYDFERLTPANLLLKSIGRKVTLWRTNPATGRARQMNATLVAANDAGVIFRTEDGDEALHCSGLPERLSFEEIPDDLRARPALSIRLASGEPGRREVRVSYLAHGFAWSADYVAHLPATGARMDLAGWITLRNLTGATFRDAQVQLVAGRLNLLDVEDGGTSTLGPTADYFDDSMEEARAQRLEEMMEEYQEEAEDIEYFGGCYPLGTTQIPRMADSTIDAILAEDIGAFRHAAGEELEEVVVTGLRGSMALREQLADYQMYRLPIPTDLHARQTKQVAFLHKPDVVVDRFYSLRIATEMNYDPMFLDEDNALFPLGVKVAWRNLESDGLGEPLPAGQVRFFEQSDSGAVFAGDDRLGDSPVGTPVELVIGHSMDLGFAIDDAPEEAQPGWLFALNRRVHLPLNFRIVNAKPGAVSVEIRQGPMMELDNMRVTRASMAPQRKSGDYLWRFSIPARETQILSYTISGRERE